MKKFLTGFLMIFLISFGILAESNVTIGVQSISGSDTEIYINGQLVCDLNGPVKKEIAPVGPMVISIKELKDCYRKIILPEGNYIVAVNIDFLNPVLNEHTQFKAETALDIEDGENIYLELDSDGLTDIKINELTEKEAQQKFKKWEELPAVQME